MKRSRFLLPTVTCAVVLVACAGSDPAPTTTASSTSTSVESLEATREAVGPAVVEVGRSARRVMAAADAIEGAPATVELLADEVRALERATDDVRALASSAALPADVVTTLEAAAAAGDELAALGERAGTGIELQLELGGRVEDLVARWDDDASRSQQLERLGEVEDELREIADADAVAPSDCDDGVSTWLAVAERAAEITAELLVHVGGYDGTSFDATRADGRVEVAQLAPGAPSPSSCAALDGMRAAAAALDVALVDVEDALNPPELVTDG